MKRMITIAAWFVLLVATIRDKLRD